MSLLLVAQKCIAMQAFITQEASNTVLPSMKWMNGVEDNGENEHCAINKA